MTRRGKIILTSILFCVAIYLVSTQFVKYSIENATKSVIDLFTARDDKVEEVVSEDEEVARTVVEQLRTLDTLFYEVKDHRDSTTYKGQIIRRNDSLLAQ